MFKENLSVLLYVLPALIVTYHASNLIDEVWEENRTLKEQVWELQNNCDTQYTNKISYKVTVTTYNPTKEQCDDTPLITADGSKIDPYKVSSWNWIAVSQHMLTRNGGPLNYGDTVYIFGTEHKDGMYIVKDCMNKRKTNQIDFLESLGTPQYKYDNVVIARFPQENLDS